MKGQTAIEYLMTYGWVILIILIVVGVLAYYGIFNPEAFLGPIYPNECINGNCYNRTCLQEYNSIIEMAHIDNNINYKICCDS